MMELNDEFSESPDPREKGNPADLTQLDSVVAHLDRDIGAYLKMGLSSELQLTADQLLTVLDWARQINDGKEISAPESSPIDFFMTGLLEDIIQIPSNVFEEVEFPDGRMRHMPIRPEVWGAALDRYLSRLKKSLEDSKLESHIKLDEKLFSRMQSGK